MINFPVVEPEQSFAVWKLIVQIPSNVCSLLFEDYVGSNRLENTQLQSVDAVYVSRLTAYRLLKKKAWQDVAMWELSLSNWGSGANDSCIFKA